MILFNETLSIQPELVEECLIWLRNEHLPAIMGKGIFKSYRISEMLAPIEPEQEGTVFSLQFVCSNFNEYLRYEKDFAPELRQIFHNKFQERVLVFRSVMEILEEK